MRRRGPIAALDAASERRGSCTIREQRLLADSTGKDESESVEGARRCATAIGRQALPQRRHSCRGDLPATRRPLRAQRRREPSGRRRLAFPRLLGCPTPTGDARDDETARRAPTSGVAATTGDPQTCSTITLTPTVTPHDRPKKSKRPPNRGRSKVSLSDRSTNRHIRQKTIQPRSSTHRNLHKILRSSANNYQEHSNRHRSCQLQFMADANHRPTGVVLGSLP